MRLRDFDRRCLMSVSDGEPGSAANFNSSYMSREVDTSTAGKVDLNNSGSSTVVDAQKNIVDEATWSGRLLNGASGVPAWISNAIGLITDNVRQRLEAVQAAVETNQTNISTNTTDIGTNQTNISANTSDIADIRTTTGTADGDTDMGTFTGTTISDNVSVKTALQELETAVENIPGPLTFKGSWNADTNTPTLASGVGNAGDVYIVSVAGTTNLDGITDWQPTDWAAFDGSVWVKVDNSEANLGADKFLSNLTAPTAINQSLLPDGDNSRDIGDATNGFKTVSTNSLNVGKNGGGAIGLQNNSGSGSVTGFITGGTGTLPSGVSANVRYRLVYPNPKMGITSDSNNSADATPTGDIHIETGNKSNAGATGDSGSIYVVTGTVAGSGQRGKFVYQDGTQAANRILTCDANGAASWAPNTGGGTGFRNFIDNQDSTLEDEDTVGGWYTFENPGGYSNGDGGSPTTITVETENATPLVGTRSLQINKAATDATNEGISLNGLGVDLNLRGRDLQGSFEYDFSDANYTSGDAAVKAYDQTNANELTVINGSIPNNKGKLSFGVIGLQDNTALVRFSIFWQTDSHTASTATHYIDEIRLGDEGPVQGVTFGTDWIDYTPTFTGFGTATNIDFQYRQDGSDILIRGNFTAGTTTATEARVSLPNSFTVKANEPVLSIAGHAARTTATSPNILNVLIEPSVSYLTFGVNGSNGLSKTVGTSVLNSAEDMSLEARVPVAELASSANLPVRVGLEDGVVFRGVLATGAVGGSPSVISFTAAEDTVGGWSTNTYTIKQDGYYELTGVGTASNAYSAGHFLSADFYDPVNAVSYGQTLVQYPNAPAGSIEMATTPHAKGVYFNAGDQVQMRVWASAGATINTSYTHFSIIQIPSPVVNLDGSSKVAYVKDVKSNGVTAGAATAGSWFNRVLNTLEGDTSFITLSSNQFTLEPGTYQIEGSVPARAVNSHKSKLRDVTNSVDVIIGQSCLAGGAESNTTHGRFIGTFTIATATTFAIQQRVQSSQGSSGLGWPSGLGVNEVYTQAKITKVK